jgi:RNA polymerase sigma factor (sigma-70 family)
VSDTATIPADRYRARSLRGIPARDALALQWAHLPVVVFCQTLKNNAAVQRLGLEDARQEGFVALLRAAESWDEARGVPFSRYAMACIVNRLLVAAARSGVISISQQITCGALVPESWLVDAARARRCLGLSEAKRSGYLPELAQRPDEHASTPDAGPALRALSRLKGREREVVERVVMGGQTLTALATEWQTSREWARQVKKTAIARLRRVLGVED